MLLTITARPPADADWPATDLGFLLHKNPARAQRFDLPFGQAHVLYPEANAEVCTAALLVEIDPVGLVRGRTRITPGFGLGQYVNDRPYAASSLLASAMAKVFGSALHGRCEQRPRLAASVLPLRLEVPALPCRGGPDLASRLFEPLGWQVRANTIALDPAFPDWGDSPYLHVVLRGELRLSDALSHLYVLLPVLDDAKHYWVSIDEVDKLVRAGGGWLGEHPERDLITRRYLARRRSLVDAALARLAETDDLAPERFDASDQATAEPADGPEGQGPSDPTGEGRPLAELRRAAVLDALREAGARRVLDLGCGEGQLLAELVEDSTFAEIVGVDVSTRALSIAARRLRLDQLADQTAKRLTLRQGSLTYVDPTLRGYDAAVLAEVVEHVDAPRLGALAQVVFGDAHPRAVVVTTPNAEHNIRFPGLASGAMRHRDHRFEWTRAQFRHWAEQVAASHGYRVAFRPVGAADPLVGPPTQLALFTATEGLAG